jgi:quercetin dioxygenase-like cupin family protein
MVLDSRIDIRRPIAGLGTGELRRLWAVQNQKIHIVMDHITTSMSFKAVQYDEVPLEDVNEEGAIGAKIRWLINKKDDAENFSMRYFEVEEGGRSPVHSHPWEHEVFVVKGKCKVVCNDESGEVEEGGVIFVPPNTDHNFMNVGDGPLHFICVIPMMD